MKAVSLFFIIILLFTAANLFSESEILIGASLSLTAGNTGPSNMIYNGYRMWVDEVNSRGGLLGRRVNLRVYDDRGDPVKVREYYKRLIEEDRADLLFSPYSTPLTLAAADVAGAAGYAVIASGASGNALFEQGNNYIFGMYAPAERFSIGFLDVCARQGYENITVLYENNPFNIDVALGAELWGGKFGLEITLMMVEEPASADTAAIVERLKRSGTAAVFVSFYERLGYEFLSELDAQNYKPEALAMVIIPIHPEFFQRAGSIGEGVFGPSQWEPNERIPYPGTLEFITNFRKTYGGDPSYHAGSAYAACEIIEAGVTANNSLDQDRLRNYISMLDTVTVIGRFKTDRTGKQIGHNPILIQWQNGKKEIVYPRSMQTAPPVFP